MKFLALLATLFASGCTNLPKGIAFAQFKPSGPDGCAVYIYRQSERSGSGQAPTIVVDGRSEAPLENGGFIRRDLPCGPHRLELMPRAWHDLKPMQIEITLEKGVTKFLKYSVTHLGSSLVPAPLPVVAFTYHRATAFKEVTQAIALDEMKETSSID